MLDRFENALAVLEEVRGLAEVEEWAIDWRIAHIVVLARSGATESARAELLMTARRFTRPETRRVPSNSLLLASGIVAFHEGRHERAEALLGRLIVVQSPAATAILYEYLADLWGWPDDGFADRRDEHAAAMAEQVAADRRPYRRGHRDLLRQELGVRADVDGTENQGAAAAGS
jgi:hypothetical protein